MAAPKSTDCWPWTSDAYVPELEIGSEIKLSFDDFAKSHLSNETDVRILATQTGVNDIRDNTVNEQKLIDQISKVDHGSHQLIFINRYLIRNRHATPVPEPAKLRISKTAFEALISHYSIYPAFIFALTRYFLPTGNGHSSLLSWAPSAPNPSTSPLQNGDNPSQSPAIHDFWYFLPLRIQVRCTDSRLRHTASTAGSNQMNPFHYLHLQDQRADIRGSQNALYFRYDVQRKSYFSLSVNLLDGRWPKTVEEPMLRIKETLKRGHHVKEKRAGSDESGGEVVEDPFCVHLVYLTSGLRWWTNALHSIDNQLITYEGRLQEDSEENNRPEFQQDLNKALHAMAAHLHRYAAELRSFEEIVTDIDIHHKSILGQTQDMPRYLFDRVETGLYQVASQLHSIKSFEMELEKKIQNILALLFNRIQLSNDRIMVANGSAMQEMMRATQEETKMSRFMAIRAHELTEEMKKDSLSMKTIAILTMFFLPGTSFAALLAMPFFSSNKWLGEVDRFWIWIALTVPSTGLAFAFYYFWKQRGEKAGRKNTPNTPLSDIETGRINGASGARQPAAQTADEPEEGAKPNPTIVVDGS